jgi:hypothetical protein
VLNASHVGLHEVGIDHLAGIADRLLLWSAGVVYSRIDMGSTPLSKPQLTVEQLRKSDFQEIGCWELNSARDLSHSLYLPSKPGVYAFAIGGVVQYVGLASQSVRQRLGFYRKPGNSQRTNVRLNEIIRERLAEGARVEILIAHPPDQQWNGLVIKGAEGLEAGLIGEFDLPWNMRGTQTARPLLTPAPEARAGDRLADRILGVVRRRPGMTELEIARAVCGPAAVQQQVNQDCRLLVSRNSIRRVGRGGRNEPFTYFPAIG